MKEETNAMVMIEQTKELCSKLMQTPHYKKMGAEGIFAIVQKAKAVGVDPLDALNGGMYYVQGKVEMTASMMNDLIRRKGHSITKDKKSDEKVCILHGKRRDNNDTWSESFSIDDAKQAGIYRNQWLKYPKDMLFARALSRLARQLFPDVIKGCYVEQEIAMAIEKVEDEKSPEIEMGLAEIEELIKENIFIEQGEHLASYLEFCKSKVNDPLTKVVMRWLDNPEPFLNHYKKWCERKEIAKNNTLNYEEEDSSENAEHA